MNPPRMSLGEYKKWMKNPLSTMASLPEFFDKGVKRTIRVLKGTATESEKAKWRSFGARHYAQYKKNNTCRRAIALRNWGYRIRLPKACKTQVN